MAAQVVPDDGWDGPAGGLIEKWWTEALVILLMVVGPVWWIILSIRRSNVPAPFVLAIVLVAAVRYLSMRGFVLVGVLYVVAAVSLLTGVGLLARRSAGPNPP